MVAMLVQELSINYVSLCTGTTRRNAHAPRQHQGQNNRYRQLQCAWETTWEENKRQVDGWVPISSQAVDLTRRRA